MPSGTIFVGISLTVRDYLHDHGGLPLTFAAIFVGAVLSWWVAPGLAVASGVTFAVAETANLVVYARLRAKRRRLALILSNVVGAVVDSTLFIGLAFGIGAVARFAPSLAVAKLLLSLVVAVPLMRRSQGSRGPGESFASSAQALPLLGDD